MKNGKTTLTLLAVLLLCAAAAAVGIGKLKKGTTRENTGSEGARLVEDTDHQGIGNVEVFTLKVEEGMDVQRASYSFSGRVLLVCRDGAETVLCSMDDDGTDIVEIYRGGPIAGNRLLPFWDNTRILMGDGVLECPEGYNLDNCPKDAAKVVPIVFPDAFVDGPEVLDKWTEVIISPDNGHLAWTIRRSDCGAVNAMGRLVRTENAYEIRDAAYISNMNAFRPDPDHPGYSLYSPVIGGEVKQFVRGGRAISLVGSGAESGGMGDSVVQDVATGEVTRITYNPGYDETTIFSPDEKLGIVMTTRFSKPTDMAVLGLVPRPFGEVLHNIMGQIYMYGVVGVRRVREGNVGPALINIEQSMTEDGYMGLDLSDPDQVWVYHSPMSWKSDGTAAMWLERERGGEQVRVQIVRLLDYKPGKAVAAVPVPAVGSYARDPENLDSYDVKVLGAFSGSASIKKVAEAQNKTTVTVVYDHYSDDGKVFWDGSETSTGAFVAETTYAGDLLLTDAEGKKLGGMDVKMAMSAAYSMGSLFGNGAGPTLDKDACSGSATWGGIQKDIEDLVP